MQLISTLRYDAPGGLVSKMLTDSEFYRLVGQKLQAVSCSSVQEPDQITTTFELAAPEVLRAIVGAELQLVARLRWTTPLAQGRRLGELDLRAQRLPATFHAAISLAEDAQATNVAYDAEYAIKIPLLGRKLEKKASGAAQSFLDAGQSIGEEWLAVHGQP